MLSQTLILYQVMVSIIASWKNEIERNLVILKEKKLPEFRLLCHERQGLEELELLGGKVFELRNYTDQEAINHIMRDVCNVIFVPENSDRRIEEGESVINSAKNQNVDYYAFLV